MTTNTQTHNAGILFSPRTISDSLGSKVIERDSIAIAEQIKNAVDATADKIVIDFTQMYQDDCIVITDNGGGMTLDEIKYNWLLVSTNNKVNDSSLSGGKGIGRFSLFRLCDEIKIETVNNGVLYHFTINKHDLEQHSNTNDITIQIHQESITSMHKTGTTIYLTKLSDEIDLDEIAIDLENLNEPFTKKRFVIKYPNNYKLTKFLNIDDAIKFAPFHLSAEIERDTVTKFMFKCTSNNEVLYQNEVFNESTDLIPNNVDLGKVKFEIYNFYFDRTYVKQTGMDLDKLRNDFLSAYQGINVYRNHFKIYGHGQEDWLKLAEKRVMRTGDYFDNKLTFGYILLDSDNSLALEEKTNREGFIKGRAQKYFYAITNLIVNQFNKDRNICKKMLKNSKITPPKKTNVTPLPNNNIPNGKVIAAKPENNNTNDATDLNRPIKENNLISNPKSTNKENNQVAITTNQESNSALASKNSDVKGISIPPDGKTFNTTRRITVNKIGEFDNQLYNSLPNSKVKELIDEITRINALDFTFATTFLFRGLIEVAMNEYLIKNLSSINTYFPNYCIDKDNKVVLRYTNNTTKPIPDKDITNSKKINDFKRFFERKKSFDQRSLNHLDKLSTFIDDLNLSIHWNEKRVSYDELRTQWSNIEFFLCFLCKGIK
ncbi:ATP-binding protein [Bacillus cereus group sp. MYBK226-2]|uniref:ATP-binding protein n=1 Tax=Bacillus cereus group sp. MYBK226-2 TaxID=3450655 RepID=UPI003F79DDCD